MEATTIVVIVLVSFIALLAVALLILWVMDARISAKQRALDLQKKDYDIRTSEIVKDEVYLRIKGGRVGVLRELPVRTVVEEQPAPQPPKPIIEEYKSDFKASGGFAVSGRGREAAASAEPIDFDLAYKMLPASLRSLYEKFVGYVMDIPTVRRIKGEQDVTFRYRHHRMVRAVIRDGVPVLQFYLLHDELKRYLNERSSEEIRVGYVNIRLQSDRALTAAKEMTDIAARDINEVYNYKKRRLIGKIDAGRAKRRSANSDN